MPSPLILLSKSQYTLAKPTEWLKGYTLRNVPAAIRFLPTEENAGRSIRVLHKGEKRFEYPVRITSGRVGLTWTDALDPATGYAVGVVEHPLGALALAGIDNVVMEIDYPKTVPFTRFYGEGKCCSVPLLDGTARPYLQRIQTAGIVRQSAPRIWQTVDKTYEYTFGESCFVIAPRAQPGWSINLSMPEGKAWWRKPQQRNVVLDIADPDSYKILEEVASARASNYTYTDWLKFRAVTLGRGRKADFVAFHGPFRNAPLDGQPAYGPRETIMHRMFDILGDSMGMDGHCWQVDLTVFGGVHDDMHPLRTELQKRLFPLT